MYKSIPISILKKKIIVSGDFLALQQHTSSLTVSRVLLITTAHIVLDLSRVLLITTAHIVLDCIESFVNYNSTHCPRVYREFC